MFRDDEGAVDEYVREEDEKEEEEKEEGPRPVEIVRETPVLERPVEEEEIRIEGEE